MSTLTPRIDKCETNAYGNLIHNGSLRITQRYGTPSAITRTVTTATDNSFHFDRWNSYCAGTTAKGYTIAGVNDSPTYSQVGMYNNYCFQYTQNTSTTTAQTAAADDTIEPFVYAMEGYDYAKVHGKAVTIMFWVKCSRIGTYSFYCGTTSTRTYVAPFTVSAANTWEKKMINLTLDTSTGDYNFSNQLGLWVGFFGYGGTNFRTSSVNQWVAGKYCQYSSTTALQATDTVRIAFVQMVEGTLTDGSNVLYSDYGKTFKEELEVCQRYYEKSYPLTTRPGTITPADGYFAWVRGNGNSAGTCNLKVSKRISSGIGAVYSPNTGTAGQERNYGTGTDQNGSINCYESIVQISTSDGSTGISHGAQWVCDAEIY